MEDAPRDAPAGATGPGAESDGDYENIGFVFEYFKGLNVAAVHLTDGVLRTGDVIQFRGDETHFEQTVDSMEVDRDPVEEVQAGDKVGLKVDQHVRKGDRIFRKRG